MASFIDSQIYQAAPQGRRATNPFPTIMTSNGVPTPSGAHVQGYPSTPLHGNLANGASIPSLTQGFGRMYLSPGMAPSNLHLGLNQTGLSTYPTPAYFIANGQTYGPYQSAQFSGFPGYALPGYPLANSFNIPVPALEHRRGSHGSWSTNSEAGTPYHGPGHQTAIANQDHSPANMYHGTPSPTQLSTPFIQGGMLKNQPTYYVTDLHAVSHLHPTIPRSIPHTETRKTLEQSLRPEQYGCTNVYIRGFPPHVNDELLVAYASRFGRVLTSKAIIEAQTGLCKGFGFAMFETVPEAEYCIRGFYYRGYEVSFAKDSFNNRLKELRDPDSTNLYVSNLPKTMTEEELESIFVDYHVESSRILRDSKGSRGVGFARFDTPEICDEIIARFHGHKIGVEGLPLQIRYADTQRQKELKKETVEKRIYRAREYSAVTRGAPWIANTRAPFSIFHSNIPQPILNPHASSNFIYHGIPTPPYRPNVPVDNQSEARSVAAPSIMSNASENHQAEGEISAPPSLVSGDTHSSAASHHKSE
ncbi:MAG: hypothetical protein M1829_003162 [Trizodia sp. TS-e1964]|nr:MAG: hypothetical protein M1829_003162 [Trizodia sp. TS-e1964]